MSTLWAVDPSSEKQALAVFHDGVLVWVGFWPARSRLQGRHPDALVVERMRVYPLAPTSKGRGARGGAGAITKWVAVANDLIAVSKAAGVLEGMQLQLGGVPAVEYDAPTWKGQIDKPTHHGRLWAVLSPAERAVFAAGARTTVAAIEARLAEARHAKAIGKEPKYDQAWHNLMDAAGLGLFHLKRTGRAGALF